jgi:hypothetical protein
MGDRGIVLIREDTSYAPKEGQYGYLHLYTHWSGTEWADLALAAVGKARERWGDSPYATRIVLTELIGSVEGATGYGVTLNKCESEHDVPVYDLAEQVAYTITSGDYDAGRYGVENALDGVRSLDELVPVTA